MSSLLASPPLQEQTPGLAPTGVPDLARLGLKLLALGITVIIAQLFIAGFTLTQYCRPETAPTIRRVLRFDKSAMAADVLLFGDSTNFHVDPNDADKRSITEYLAERIPGQRIVPMTAPAYHAQVYEAYVRRMLSLPRRPRMVVIPVNLRSFSPEWYRCPEYQFVEQRLCLWAGPTGYGAYVEPAAVFKAVDFSPISQKEWAATAIFDGTTRVGTVASHDPNQLDPTSPADRRKYITYIYMGRLDRQHPYLKSLVNTVQMLRKAKIAPVVYITPVDQETAAEWYGPDFRSRLAPNIELIRQSVTDAGGTVIDMSFSLRADQFTYLQWPSEHLKESGRRDVAERLAAGMAGALAEPVSRTGRNRKR